MDVERCCSLDVGRWAFERSDVQRWMLDVGNADSRCSRLDVEGWTFGRSAVGCWTLEIGRWTLTLDVGHWALDVV